MENVEEKLCKCGCGTVVKHDYALGHHRRGKVHSEESKEKMRNKIVSEESKEKMREAKKGKPNLNKGKKYKVKEEEKEKLKPRQTDLESQLPKLINMILERQHSKGRHKLIANALAKEIKDDGFDVYQENVERFCSEQKCSIGVYYYVRKLLINSGLIKKKKQKLIINLEFLAKISKEWSYFMFEKT